MVFLEGSLLISLLLVFRWKQMTKAARAPKRGERNSCTDDDDELLEIDL